VPLGWSLFCRQNHKPRKSIWVEFEFFTPKYIKTAILSSPKIWGQNNHYQTK